MHQIKLVPGQEFTHYVFLHMYISKQCFDCVGINETSTLVDHLVSSPREKEENR